MTIFSFEGTFYLKFSEKQGFDKSFGGTITSFVLLLFVGPFYGTFTRDGYIIYST